MIFAHLALLVVGIVAGFVASDVLMHRGLPSWPLLLVVLVLVGVSGWLYSAPLLAFTLGLALSASTVAAVSWTKSFLTTRAEYKHAARTRRERERRRLEQLRR